MIYVSSLLRIVCGLVVVTLVATTYSRNAEHIKAGEPMQIFGHATNAAPWQLTLGFVVLGLIGTFMIVLGCINFLKSR